MKILTAVALLCLSTISRAQDEATAFFDSIRTQRTELLKHLPRCADCNQLVPSSLIANTTEAQAVSCRTRMGDRLILTLPADSTLRLYAADVLLDGTITQPRPLEELTPDDPLDQQNYPFLLPDGQTLYYAQGGQILISISDDTHHYLEPTLLPPPEEAEDAFSLAYALCESHQIGAWAVADDDDPGSAIVYYFTLTPEASDPKQQLRQCLTPPNAKQTPSAP